MNYYNTRLKWITTTRDWNKPVQHAAEINQQHTAEHNTSSTDQLFHINGASAGKRFYGAINTRTLTIIICVFERLRNYWVNDCQPFIVNRLVSVTNAMQVSRSGQNSTNALFFPQPLPVVCSFSLVRFSAVFESTEHSTAFGFWICRGIHQPWPVL